MGEIVFDIGREARRHSLRGAARTNAMSRVRLYRVGEEALTLEQIRARLRDVPLGTARKSSVRKWVQHQQKKGPLTWDVLRTYKPREASNV